VHDFSVIATDLAGIVGQSSMDIVIDVEYPEVDIDKIVKPVLIGTTIMFEGMVNDDIDIKEMEIVIGDTSLNITDYSILNQSWSYQWNTSKMAEGVYTISVNVEDYVGKQNDGELIIQIISNSTDTDKDGMPDWWELLFDRLDYTKNDAESDFDRDGFSNLDEYLGDDREPNNDDYTDPTDKNSVPQHKDEGASSKTGDYSTIWIVLVIVVIIILLFLFMFFKKKKEKFTDPEKLEKPVQAHSEGLKIPTAGEPKPSQPPQPFPIQPIPPQPQKPAQSTQPIMPIHIPPPIFPVPPPPPQRPGQPGQTIPMQPPFPPPQQNKAMPPMPMMFPPGMLPPPMQPLPPKRIPEKKSK
jgi:LPXTG-motif cell wall-anchored protein